MLLLQCPIGPLATRLMCLSVMGDEPLQPLMETMLQFPLSSLTLARAVTNLVLFAIRIAATLFFPEGSVPGPFLAPSPSYPIRPIQW